MGTSFSCWFRGVRVLSFSSEVSPNSIADTRGPGDCGTEIFTADKVEGVEHKGSEDTTMAEVKILLEDFLEDYFPQLLKYEDLQTISIKTERLVLCYYKMLRYLNSIE